MGIITNILREKHEQQWRETQKQIDAYRAVLGAEDANPAAREWAIENIASMAEGKKPGSKPSSGQQQSPIRMILGTLLGKQPQQKAQGTPQGAPQAPDSGQPAVSEGGEPQQAPQRQQMPSQTPQPATGVRPRLLMTPDEVWQRKETEAKDKLRRDAAEAEAKEKAITGVKETAKQLAEERDRQQQIRDLAAFDQNQSDPKKSLPDDVYRTMRAEMLSKIKAPAATTRPLPVSEQQRNDALEASAQRLGKPVAALTAQERIDATKKAAVERTPSVAEQNQEIAFQAYADRHGKKPEELSAGEKQQAIAQQKTAEEPADVKAQRALTTELARQRVEDAKAAREQLNIPEGVTGDAALKGQPEGIARLAKLIANYDVPLPGSFALANPKSPWNKAMQLAKAYDPSFSEREYDVRKQLRKSFTSGTDSQNVTSINTVVKHIDSLNRAIDDMSGARFLPMSGKYQASVKRFDIARQAVANELTRVYRGTNGAEGDVKGWEASLSPTDTKDALHKGVQEAVELLGGRVYSLKDKYERGMGKPIDFDIVTPESRKIIAKIGGSSAGPAKPSRAGQQIDAETAKAYVEAAGGDKDKARQAASADGWKF